MKKALFAVLTALVLMSFFGACTKSNPTSVEQTVIVTGTPTTVVIAPTATPGTWDDSYPSADSNGNIYFASNNGLSGSGIYSVKTDGTGMNKIEAGSGYRGLEVSEDGQFLFVRATSGSATKRIIMSNGNPQSTYTLTSATDIAGFGASWVSNTAQVIYNATSGAYTGLFIQNTISGSPVEVSLSVAKLNNSIHSNPFGKYGNGNIVYQFYNNNTLRYDVVKITDFVGGGATLTGFDTGNSYTPAFSADGSKIIYVNDADGNKKVWTMVADGTGKAKLFDTTANETYPRYVPGTTKIVFVSDVTGNTKLYTIDATGNTNTIKRISQ